MTCEDLITKLSTLETIQKLTPQEVSEYQLFLASNLYTAGNQIILAEQEFSKAWNVIRQSDNVDSDKRADRIATSCAEWVKLQQAKYAYKTIEECIRSLKKMLSRFESEAKNQW